MILNSISDSSLVSIRELKIYIYADVLDLIRFDFNYPGFCLPPLMFSLEGYSLWKSTNILLKLNQF